MFGVSSTLCLTYSEFGGDSGFGFWLIIAEFLTAIRSALNQ
jgi:hypothetical protein